MSSLARFRADPSKVRVSIRRSGNEWVVRIQNLLWKAHWVESIDPNPSAAVEAALLKADKLMGGIDLGTQWAYPQLTDWVRAQPSGTFLLTVFSKKQTELQRFDLRDAPRKIVLSIRETELSTASFGAGVDYYAVWLSRHVSPECESKIPRGVKVYRER